MRTSAENHERLPLLKAHAKTRGRKKEPDWIPCAAPGCERSISPDAASRTRYCGPCQMRERDILKRAEGLDLGQREVELLWEEDSTLKVSDAAAIMHVKPRTLYALIAKGRVAATRDERNALLVPGDLVLRYAIQLRRVVGLKEASESMGVDYGYLRELVRRGVIKTRTTFWGHYGLNVDDLGALGAMLGRALPHEGDYNLVSFSEALGVHHSLTQKWIKQGRIRASKGMTGRVTIPHRELDRFVAQLRNRPAFVSESIRRRILEGIDERLSA